jgi:putative resolvase
LYEGTFSLSLEASAVEPRFEQFCERHGTEITVMNGETFSPEEELVRDLIAIVTVFSARLHGLRSYKNLIRAAALGKEVISRS